MFAQKRSQRSWWTLPIRLITFVGILPLVVATLSIALFGCGGGGGERPPTLSGTVTAPQGTPVASAPTFWRRLAAFLISPAEARALQGQAVPGATVKAFGLANLTAPVATTQTDDNGRYTLQLPADAVGKDIVVIAEKSVQGRTLRLSTIAADVPREGRTGVNLDAVTTLAAEQIAKFAKDNNISDLSPNAIAVIITEVSKTVETLGQLNLLVNAPDSPIPQNFGDGLRKPEQIAQAIQEVENTVNQQQSNLPAPTGDVAIAKSIVQMLRDFGINAKGIAENEAFTIQDAVTEQQNIIAQEIKVTQAFSERVDFFFGALELLDGTEPGRYRQVGKHLLQPVGSAPNDRTWVVEFTLGASAGMVLTVTTQNPIDEFALDPAAGKITLQARKSDDPNLQYDGTWNVQTDAQGNLTRISASMTLKDRELKAPITFSGAISGTPVSGSQPQEPRYKNLSFSGSLTSEFGELKIGSLTAVWFVDTQSAERLKQMELSDLSVSVKTSKPTSLTISRILVEFEDINPQQGFNEVTPKRAVFSATLQGSGITLSLTNAESTFSREVDRLDPENIVIQPKTVKGQLSYTSPTLTFNGSIDFSWENPTQDVHPGEYGDDFAPIPLASAPKWTSTLQGSMTPKVGTPANINLQVNSNPQGQEPQVQITLTLGHGTQKLSGNLTGTLKIEGQQSKGFKAFALNMTHSPSNFKVQVSGQQGQPVAGSITKADGTKVADIGEARNLGLPDLGSEIIVKYTDGTFETLQSVIPRSRLSRRSR